MCRHMYTDIGIRLTLVAARFISRRLSQTRHEFHRGVRGRPAEKKVEAGKIVEKLICRLFFIVKGTKERRHHRNKEKWQSVLLCDERRVGD